MTVSPTALGRLLGAAFAATAMLLLHSAPKADPMPTLTQSTTQFLDRPEGRIAYDDVGAGPLVILVPGLGDVRAEYRYLAPRLIEQGFRVVTLDLRGHGQSSVGWSDYTSAALGSDVVAMIRHLDAGHA